MPHMPTLREPAAPARRAPCTRAPARATIALLAAFLGAPCLGATDPAVPRFYEDAVVHFKAGDLATAEIQLKNALQRDPSHVSSRLLLGRVHIARGDGAAAEKELLLAKEAGADPTLVDAPLAEAYVLQRKFDLLLGSIFGAGHAEPVQVDILVLRGQAHVELGDLDAAESAFVEALGLRPGHVPALLGRALVMLRRGQVEQARAIVERAMSLDPDDAEARYLLGEVRRSSGDRAGAIEAYGEALGRAPQHVPARLARAALALELGRDAQAAADLDHVREHHPFDPHGRYLTALLRLREGRTEQARNELGLASSAIGAVDPQVLERHAPSLLLSGLISFLLRDYETAGVKLERYLQRHPRHLGVRTRLAAIHLERGLPSRAVEVLEPVAAEAPPNPMLHSLLGTAYSLLGQHERAARQLEKAASLAPERGTMRIELARAQLAAGAVDDALASLSSAWELMPDSPRTGLALASVHFNRRDYARAREVIEDVLRRTPENLSALNMLGATEMRMGEHDAAQASFERALSLDPGFLAARLNLATLERARGRPEAARRRHEAILEDHPEQTFSMRELASLAREEGRTEEAIRWLEKVRATDPGAMRAQLELVDLLLESGRTEPALVVARELETRAPERFDVLAAVAKAHIAGGRLDLARNKYREISKVVSFDTRALVRLARLQAAADDPEGAHWSLLKAVRGDRPDHLPARVGLVRAKLRLGDADEALRLAAEIAAEHGGIGHRLRGEALLAAGRAKEAAAAYEAAQAARPTTAGAIGLYRARLRAGDTGAALAGLREWLARNPGDLVAARALGGALVRTGRMHEAWQHHEELAQRMPDDAGVHNDLALLRHRAGQPGALEAARRAHALAPERADVLDTLGWLLVREGRPAEGLQFLREAHSRAARIPEIRYHVGVALAELGRVEEARAELEAALAGGDAFDGAEHARELLGRLERRS